MNGLIVFNSSNDVVYQNLNSLLAEKICSIAITQGLLPDGSTAPANGSDMDSNILLQIFSPIISSQRIMHGQFDNAYASVQCDNGFNIVFGELLGFTFLKIDQIKIEQLTRQLGVAITLTRYCYGANLFGAQAGAMQQELLTQCLNCYETQLCQDEQAYLLEALPKLLINTELKRTVHLTLDATLEQLRQSGGQQRAHALLLVSHKLVALNSTRQALPLSAADLLFLAMLTRALQLDKSQRAVAVFLQGVSHDPNSGCVPTIVHISRLHSHQVLLQLIEYGHMPLTSSIYDTFFVLQKIVAVQQQNDSDALKPAYENLETFVNQTLAALKRFLKQRPDEVDICIKKFSLRWDNLRRMYLEYFKNYERELLVRIESNLPAFVEELKQLFTITLAVCDSASNHQLDQLAETASVVEAKLLEFSEFLAVKAARNISIDAYLEDFPGLVHFMYLNRNSGQMLAPDLRSSNPQLLPKANLWEMVELTRKYLKKGQTTVMWKDRTFHYSYFLWFEDLSGGIVKCALDLQQHFISTGFGSGNGQKNGAAEPGALAMDYYSDLAEICFPKLAPGKVRVYELYCIHLGLVTATCAVEHARRLVATISDVIGEESF
ncbi:HPS1 [Drosophila busckii]|uniref:HPS1 n=1 Tax=Drosophila busckii TaxID=30019 RepID=A0A0M5J032_DROBS|nr:Hermansky-Pudlak syndrome 1 protein homolog [Drosophila busckii]ALC41824.1 HPS1 [Drosophila busckii]